MVNDNYINNLLIWDEQGAPPAAECTLLWRSYSENSASSVVSIPKLVEDNALELRSRYLAWVYELGENQYLGKRIVDHLQMRPNLSFWWMTLLVEKCNFAKSKQIDDAIRLLAFEKWLCARKIGCLKLVSANANLGVVIKKWCHENGVKFEWCKKEEKTSQPHSWKRGVVHRLPLSLRALLWLFYKAWASWPLRGVGVNAWREASAKVTFVSYFDNLVPQAVLAGRFESRYWAHLPNLLKEDNINARWLHLWVKDRMAPTAAKARHLIDQFSEKESDGQVHATLESFISLKLIWATFKDWCRLLRLGRPLKKALAQVSGGARFNLWPLVRADWRKSLYGQEAMSNLLMLNLFETALADIPYQSVGAYLQENQGWEFGLIEAWRQRGHGRLIGVPHSTVRFWDLRYHFDPRNYKQEGKLRLPWPDSIAVNGPATKAALCESGYLAEQLVDVEALRYLHLLNGDNHTLGMPKNGKCRVLVIGDYVEKNTAAQMSLLEKCVTSTKIPIDIIVKPHPNCSIRPEDYPRIDFTVTNEPLSALLADCDAAYTSSVTSGAVDAYCAGIPVISVLDEKSLNLSPLRGLPRVIFITTAEELGCTVSAIADRGAVVSLKADYFNLGPSLSMWIDLLNDRDKKPWEATISPNTEIRIKCAKY